MTAETVSRAFHLLKPVDRLSFPFTMLAYFCAEIKVSIAEVADQIN